MEVASSCGVLTGGDANTTKRWAAKNACTARDDISSMEAATSSKSASLHNCSYTLCTLAKGRAM